jgi:hypothetical protein
MAVRENYVDNYVRSIKISMSGKSDEALLGTSIVIQSLLRFAQGLRKEEQPYETMLELLEKLSREIPIGKAT